MALRLVLHVASHKRHAGTQGRRDAGTQGRRHVGTQAHITKTTKDCPCPAFCIHECGIQDTAPQADTLRTKAPMAAQQRKQGAVTTPAGSLPPSHLVCAVHPLLTEGQEALLHEPSVEPNMKQLGTRVGGGVARISKGTHTAMKPQGGAAKGHQYARNSDVIKRQRSPVPCHPRYPGRSRRTQ